MTFLVNFLVNKTNKNQLDFTNPDIPTATVGDEALLRDEVAYFQLQDAAYECLEKLAGYNKAIEELFGYFLGCWNGVERMNSNRIDYLVQKVEVREIKLAESVEAVEAAQKERDLASAALHSYLEYNEHDRSFVVIPQNDLKWVTEQTPAVNRLFHECWLADPYGSRWLQLNTKLKPTAFKKAKKVLSNQGLFVFTRQTSIRDGRATVCWLVRNLHGSRVKEFWKQVATTATEVATTATEVATTATEVVAATSISPENQSNQGFQKPSITFQKHFNNNSRESCCCRNEIASRKSDEISAAQPENRVRETRQERDPQIKPEIPDLDQSFAAPLPPAEKEKQDLVAGAGIAINSQLVRELAKHPLDAIEVAVGHYTKVKRQKGKPPNPGGWLVKCLREEWWLDSVDEYEQEFRHPASQVYTAADFEVPDQSPPPPEFLEKIKALTQKSSMNGGSRLKHHSNQSC